MGRDRGVLHRRTFGQEVRAAVGAHSVNHRDRLSHVGSRHRAIASEFYELYYASLVARYEANGDFYAQFANADIQRVVIDGWLAAVETYVDALGALTP